MQLTHVNSGLDCGPMFRGMRTLCERALHEHTVYQWQHATAENPEQLLLHSLEAT